MIQELIAACDWAPNPYFLFSGNVFSNLIYYSHLTPILVSLALGAYVYFSNSKSLINKVLFTITLILGMWLLLDLVLWATDSIRLVMFSWSIVNMLEPIIYAGFVYFVYVFVLGRDVGWKTKLLIVVPFLPSLFLAGTVWNVLGFDLTNCDREVVEGPIAFYNYIIEILYSIWILCIGIWCSLNKGTPLQKRRSMMVVGTTLVLLLGFASGNIAGSFTEDWAIGQYGLFVLPISVGTLAYFIIQFRFIAQSQLAAVQFLIIGLWLAVASVLFIQSLEYARWIVGATLIFLTLIGYLLVKSVRKEIEQREQIERLAKDLEKANDRQVTLIHFITHQIKGFLTKSRNVFAGMMEGDYGILPESAAAMAKAGFESDTAGVNTVQEILNASNIKSGKVTYAMAPFDLKQLIDEIAAGLRPNAEKKGLTFTVTTGSNPLTVTGDRAQLVNVYKNLIDNSIKYTPSGSVSVTLVQAPEKAVFTIEDTGVGITPEDMQHLFTEGGHGKDSLKINTESTGFGLYIVKNIIDAHKGKVWAESEGTGKGSRFFVELPI